MTDILDPIEIDDPSDPRLAPYAEIRERDLVGRQGRFIVEGEVALRIMLSGAARFGLESILLTSQRFSALRDAIRIAEPRPPVFVANKDVMGAIAGFPMHRGVLAVGVRGDEPDPAVLIPPSPQPAIILGLVGLTNHDNIGGLFRNAAAFGADAVWLDAPCCDPLYRKAIRVSAGAALTVPFARFANADRMLALAQSHDLDPLALTPSATAEIVDATLPERALVLLGTEGTGLPPAVLERAQPLRIGMVPGFDSLNVATAGAIVLHRLHRRRGSAAPLE